MSIKKHNIIKLVMISFLCCLFFAMFIIWGYVTYETNDDKGLNLIAAGVFGNDNRE